MPAVNRPTVEQVQTWLGELMLQVQVIDGALDQMATTLADMALSLACDRLKGEALLKRAQGVLSEKVRAIRYISTGEAGVRVENETEGDDNGDVATTKANGTRELGNDGRDEGAG